MNPSLPRRRRSRRLAGLAVLALGLSVTLLGTDRLAAAAADDEDDGRLRLRWNEGDLFTYRLEADVRQGSLRAEVRGEVRLRAFAPRAAYIERVFRSIRRTADGETWEEAGVAELDSQRVMVPLWIDGVIPEDVPMDAAQRQAAEGFVARLFPMPGRAEVGADGGWDFVVSGGEERLAGRATPGRTVGRYGYPCLEVRFSARSKESGAELEGKAWYSKELGIYLGMERELRTPGDEDRVERMTLTLRRHPTGPILDPEYRESLEISGEAIENDPENASAWARRAEVLARGGSREEALAAIRKARALDEDEVPYREQEGMILAALGDLDGALGVFEGIIEAHPGHVDAHLHAARIWFQREDFARAERYAKKAREIDPRASEALFLLGLTYGRLGETDVARDLIRGYFEELGREPPVVTFDSDGNLRLILPRPEEPDRPPPPLTAEERELAEQFLAKFVEEETERVGLGEEALHRLLEYLAASYGRDTDEMVADFLRDREKTWAAIGEALDGLSRLHPERLRELARSGDADLQLGAAFYLPLDEAVPIVEALLRPDPTRSDLRLHLASIILRGDPELKTWRGAFIRAVRSGKDFDPENALFGHLLASVFVGDPRTMLRAPEEAQLALQRPAIRTLRASQMRVCRRVLAEMGFDPAFRGAAAWSHSASPFGPALRREAAGLIALAGVLETEGKIDDARALLETVRLLALQIRGTAEEAALYRQAGEIEKLALSRRLAVEEQHGSAEDRQRVAGWLAAATEVADREKTALEAHDRQAEEALDLEPITNPASTRAYLRQVLASERSVLLRHLEETARPDDPDPEPGAPGEEGEP